MYAVIETGGKQYRVSPGQTVEVELLPAEPGNEVALDRVLLVSTGTDTLVGQPTVAGARVIGTVVREGRGPKIIVFKFKSKKRHRNLNGHRQDYMYLQVTDIQANGKSLVEDDDRKRFERQAQRAANRYETKLLTRLGGELVAVATEPVAARPAAAPKAQPKQARASRTAQTTTSEPADEEEE